MTERPPKFDWEKLALRRRVRKGERDAEMVPLDNWQVKLGQQSKEILAATGVPQKTRAMVLDITNKAFIHRHDLSWKQCNAIEKIWQQYVGEDGGNG